MTNKNETNIERELRRTFRRYRASQVLLVLICLGAFLVLGYYYFTRAQTEHYDFPVPDYSALDPAQPTYWNDRIQYDMKTAGVEQFPPDKRDEFYRNRIAVALRDIRKIKNEYYRVNAIVDVVTALIQRDSDIGVGEILETLVKIPNSQVAQSQLYVDLAMMYLRQKKNILAQGMVHEYHQLLANSDLWLDTEQNIRVFSNAVTVLFLLKSFTELDTLFDQVTKNTAQMNAVDKRERAFRLITAEQARAQLDIAALKTTRMISRPLELSRSYQMIVAQVSRPPILRPVDGFSEMPPIDGPWGTLPSETTTQRVLTGVFQEIAGRFAPPEQTDLLLRLANSRLMCDPELYRVFLSELQTQTCFKNAEVTKPALHLLSEPESDAIRRANGLPIVADKPRLSSDPALDDWTSPVEHLSVEVLTLSPTAVQGYAKAQEAKIQLIIAQSFLSFSELSQAAKTLQQSSRLASHIVAPIDRISLLFNIAELQVRVGDAAGCHETLQEILQSEANNSLIAVPRLPQMARYYIAIRFFDDALNVIERVASQTEKDRLLGELITEYLKIGQRDAAEKVVAKISDDSFRLEAENNISLAQDGATAQMVYDENTPASELIGGIDALMKRGIFSPLPGYLALIKNVETRSRMQLRFIREYIAAERSYRGDWPLHQSVRQQFHLHMLSLISQIESPFERVCAIEAVLSQTSLTQTKSLSAQVKKLCDGAIELCVQNKTQTEWCEIYAQIVILKVKISGESSNDSSGNPTPMSTEIAAAVLPSINDIVTMINESEDELLRGRVVVLLASLFSIIDRPKNAHAMVDAAIDLAIQLDDKREGVTLLLSLVPVVTSFNDMEKTKGLYKNAINLAFENATQIEQATSESEALYLWRLCDAEQDRIARDQLKNGLTADSIETASRIRETIMRDRFLQSASYILLGRKEYDDAERAAGKIVDEGLYQSVLNHIRFFSSTYPKN